MLYIFVCIYVFYFQFLLLIDLGGGYCRIILMARCLPAFRARCWKSFASTLSVPTIAFRFAINVRCLIFIIYYFIISTYGKILLSFYELILSIK